MKRHPFIMFIIKSQPIYEPIVQRQIMMSKRKSRLPLIVCIAKVGVNLPLFDVPLSHFIMRPSIAVPRPSVFQTASD